MLTAEPNAIGRPFAGSPHASQPPSLRLESRQHHTRSMDRKNDARIAAYRGVSGAHPRCQPFALAYAPTNRKGLSHGEIKTAPNPAVLPLNNRRDFAPFCRKTCRIDHLGGIGRRPRASADGGRSLGLSLYDKCPHRRCETPKNERVRASGTGSFWGRSGMMSNGNGGRSAGS